MKHVSLCDAILQVLGSEEYSYLQIHARLWNAGLFLDLAVGDVVEALHGLSRNGKVMSVFGKVRNDDTEVVMWRRR